MSRPEPSEQEMRDALEEQMRQVTVQEVLLQSLITFVNLAGRRLGLAAPRDELDLDQARVAIDAARALAPLVDSDQAAAIRDALAQLQMAYARETRGAAGEPTPPGGEPTKEPERPAAGASKADEAERAKARAKIWTPPGA